VPRRERSDVKKSERQAKEALRKHPQALDTDHVAVVSRKGGGMQYNQGQSVKQGFGSGLKDIAASLKKKR
jgi:hypothetical protein